MESKYDFSGWATKNNLRCSDGRTIMKDAFKEQSGRTVPLVWNHLHNDPLNVLGHALLENRDAGVYAYCKFNDTESGKDAKMLVEHGDVTALSIYANQLKQDGGNVLHGAIREVSLVLAGANPGALIDSIICHDSGADDEAIIYTDESISIEHSDVQEKKEDNEPMENEEKTPKEEPKEEPKKEEPKKEEQKEIDPEKVFETLNDDQKTLVYALISQALEENADDESNKNNNKEGDSKIMKHNVFENDTEKNTLTHADEATIIADTKRYGSLKDSVLAHADEYGIENIDYLFPDAKNVTKEPFFIKRKTEWVSNVMGNVHRTPFARIKSIFADITEEEARAKGYIKGNPKKEEVFSLLKRTTNPTTIYKKQKIDRDDMIDITDFETVSWLKSEMRGMLDEELARAILVGDQRLSSSDDKIDALCIRPIWTDADLYSVKVLTTNSATATDEEKAQAFIKSIKKARKNYRGSGNPTLYCSEDVLTNCLLIEDGIGRPLYDTMDKLATTLRVKEIVTVPVMENLTRTGTAGAVVHLDGILVNLNDYNVGADKGGQVSMFDDFDIDYNQQKYLIETRCSGALTVPMSALVIESVVTGETNEE